MLHPLNSRTTLGLGLSLISSLLLGSEVAAESRPNIVLIMVDDMGFSDLGCYGGEIDTPHIDALAASGVKFSQFYNSGRCCPTRATLMTGLHPHQVGIGHMTLPPNKQENPNVPPAYQGFLNEDCFTVAEVLRESGYTTLMTGKWHLGHHREECWPMQRGFEKYYGIISGGANFFNPRSPRGVTSGNSPVESLKSTTERRYYLTDAFTDHAILFVTQTLKEESSPFFLYLAYTAPHWPLHAHDEDLAKYRGRYRDGWDELRQQRYQRQVDLGLIDSSWELSPRDDKVPAWESLDEAKQEEMDLRMALYAAMVDRVDQNVGKLISTLKDQDQLKNTWIIFLSDNGACAEGGVLGGGEVLDARKRNSKFGVISYGRAWANLSSTPYRLYKHFAHEGGTCTPFIMHWPDRISPRVTWYRQPAQLIDIFPTILEVAEATYPIDHPERDAPPLEGISLVPSFLGQPLQRNNPIFVEHENNAFLRDGKWKLVGRNVARKQGVVRSQWELYDLHADGTELQNLAADRPQIVSNYDAQWRDWADRSSVYPKVPSNKKSPRAENTK